MNIKLYFIKLICFTPLFSFAQLNGNKTIGGTNPDFTTYEDAITALNTQGVGAGGVNFIFRNGNYTGGFAITVSGTQANPINFRSESNSAADVTISVGGTAASVISLNNASFIKFEHLKINYTYTGITQSKQAITLNGNATNISFENCIIERPTSSSQTNPSSVVLLSGTSINNLIFRNNTISGGSKGLYLSMSSSNPATGLRIENCRFRNINRGSAIEIFNAAAVIIDKNEIKVETTGPGNEAIVLNNVNGKSEISNNYIFTLDNARLRVGILLTNSSSTQGNNALIYNNSIQVFNGGTAAYAIDQNADSRFWTLNHNTLIVASGDSELSRPYRNAANNNATEIRNNIFGNYTTSTNAIANQTIGIVNTSGVGLINNNCYFTSSSANGGPFRGTYGTQYNDFGAFTAATSESASINTNPLVDLIPDIGWKANAPVLQNAGVYIATIPTDIDGNTRANPSTIGAHELDADCINATITAQPTAQSACAGNQVTFTIAALGENLTYQWQFSSNNGQTWNDVAGANYTGANTNFLTVNTTEAMAGYRFRVVVQASCGSPANSNGALLTIPTTVNVTANGPLALCDGQTVTLTAASGFDSYLWNTGATTAAITVSTPGDYSVTAIGSGCTLTSQIISVTTAGNVPGGLTITPSGNVTFCAGQNLTLTAQAGFSNYVWSNGATGQTINISTPGTYSVSADVTGGCGVTSAPVTVTQVNGLPNANFTSNQPLGDYIVNFTNTSQQGGSFLWLFPNNVTYNIENPSHNFLFDGTFSVTLIVSNGCGNDTITQNIVVVKPTGINQIEGLNLILYPNPASELVVIKGNTNEKRTFNMCIINNLGQVIFQEFINIQGDWNKEIAVSHLNSGIYHLILENNGQRNAIRFIIKR